MSGEIWFVPVLTAFILGVMTIPVPADNGNTVEYGPDQKAMDLEEYLEKSGEEWFLTGKKRYTVRAMMVSKDISFHNDLEVIDYSVTDDGMTVVLKGTVGEMWTSKLEKVISTYTRPDGSALTEKDFSEKDVFIDIITKAVPDVNYAMHVPNNIFVTVKTSKGNVLHTNLPNAPHGDGDYLICRVDEEGKPDIRDVWVLNGAVFPNTYDMSRMNGSGGDKAE